MIKNPCGLDYCPYFDLVGEFASCTACSWANYEDENNAHGSREGDDVGIL